MKDVLGGTLNSGTNKQSLRRKLKTIPLDNRTVRDREICREILKHPKYKDACVVYLFCPSGAEPDISPVTEDAFRTGKTVCVPVTREEEMFFVEVTEKTQWKEGKFGIREPLPPYSEAETPDLIITPMVAFDGNLNRLGHGKGYYDRFFAAYPNGFKLGVCYACYEVESVFSAEFDVPMDDIVTERGRKQE